MLWITHPLDSDLSISLINPDGVQVDLSSGNGGGANFGSSCSPDANRTTFDDASGTSITAGSSPFVGAFKPEGSLASFVTDGTANGNWRLHVTDSFGGSVGALRCWSLLLYPITCATGNGACDTCLPPITNSLTAADAMQTNRAYRDVIVSSCATPKLWNGFGDFGPNFHYQAYTFTNNSPADACVTVELQSSSNLMAVAYLNSYDPTTISNNFLGDAGNGTGNDSLNGPTTFSALHSSGGGNVRRRRQ